METEVRFREVQQFRQPWLWGLLGAQALLVAVSLVRGRRSARATARRLLVLGGVALFFRSATLYTEVRDEGVYVKFAPLHRSFRRIPFSALADVQATGYSPLRYGGWGVRWSPSGVAYTVSGRSGVRLERANGRSVFVGSDRPDELLAAVQDTTRREV
ncbi:DUF6141 family protein [Halorussus amylolyticus]|uniref:DUF6141 family protein n=1 Tax=Halorussus amylolyticus TaxID=1126242 RepID=UPI00105273F8|nr:DUF6141 family protein [Halorussus amylolyticus]